MKILPITAPQFKLYGQILDGYDTAALQKAMLAIPLPETGTAYQPSIPDLEACAIYGELQNRAWGGMPIQIGMCWGRNTRLNCLEYHRNSEINIGTHDFILLLARQDQIIDGRLDTDSVAAFRVPAGILVEIYATALHYAPCHACESDGFRTAVVLPRGTNTDKPAIASGNEEDRRLRACNKWLLAHPEAPEADQGAYIGLYGTNIDLSKQ